MLSDFPLKPGRERWLEAHRGLAAHDARLFAAPRATSRPAAAGAAIRRTLRRAQARLNAPRNCATAPSPPCCSDVRHASPRMRRAITAGAVGVVTGHIASAISDGACWRALRVLGADGVSRAACSGDKCLRSSAQSAEG